MKARFAVAAAAHLLPALLVFENRPVEQLDRSFAAWMPSGLTTKAQQLGGPVILATYLAAAAVAYFPIGGKRSER